MRGWLKRYDPTTIKKEFNYCLSRKNVVPLQHYSIIQHETEHYFSWYGSAISSMHP